MKNNNLKFKISIKRRVYLYCLEIIKFVNLLDKKDLSSLVIAKQLIRSATSIGANIIEAQAGRSKKDFSNFLQHALKSANESKFWLGLIRDSGKSDRERASLLLQETIEISNILAASILTINGKR
jgi:four helix bundle protein